MHAHVFPGNGRERRTAAAAVSYALWIVLQKRVLRSMSPLQVTAWGTWFGALIALPFGHGPPHALGEQPAPLALLGGAIAVLGVVIVQGAGSRTHTRLTAPVAAVPRGANLLLTPKGLGHIP